MINGAILVGGESRQREKKHQATNPTSNEPISPPHSEANAQDVADACALAAEAFEEFASLEPSLRASFLEDAAERIVAIGDVLIETSMAETGLPRARLEGERGRTVGQLRLFADVVRAGEWLDATIDPALPDRSPPRPSLGRMNVALGPVAVFGASNFPLAFSVAGGDTASAFAAGCPIVVKGHPGHPGTGELVARAIMSAVEGCRLSPGVFSYLPGAAHDLGATLVSDPRIKAVAFTGSRAGGLALSELAARRAEPIPVYAEMSSINPVVLMPAALNARAEALGAAFIGSLTLGAGQFCTNPGIVLALDGADLDRFIAAASAALSLSEAGVMLTSDICGAYAQGVAALDANPAARRIAQGKAASAPHRGVGVLFETSAQAFTHDATLAREVFGAASLIVRCQNANELIQAVSALEGQLTATLHLDPADEPAAARIMPLLRAKAGRVLANGWPTGVEVTHAMVHGGPYPATTDARTTSVGSLAVMRFVRPVCYQDVPESLLPPPLKASNPWNAPRRINGRREAL